MRRWFTNLLDMPLLAFTILLVVLATLLLGGGLF